MSAKTLVIRIKKGNDGGATLSCVRPSGTVTWQRQEGGRAAFFPRHDLTHFAVESVLGIRRGFYGLVAEGWDLSDFGTPWPRGHLPSEANIAEVIVGFFDRERASGVIGSAEELNELVRDYCLRNDLTHKRTYTEDDAAQVRRQREDLFARWDAVLPGLALEVEFPIDAS